MFDLGWLAQDLRFGARVVRRRAGFSITAVATLALAMGANAAIFTVVDRALLRRLPYANPDRLVAVFHHDATNARNDKASGAEIGEWRARTSVLSDIAFSWDAQYTLTSAAPPITLRAFQVSANLFSLLGAQPALGRAFTAGDDVAGADHVVVLSEHLWRTAFGGSRAIVGRVIRLDDAPYVVVGVMPARFAHPDAAIDLWTPLAIPPGLASNRSLHAFNVVARLSRGVSQTAAANAFGREVAIRSLRDVYVGSGRSTLWALQGAVLLLLIIATANIANLGVAHATTVQREVAVRLALGASRVRVMGQFLTLAAMISTAGGVMGLLLGSFALDAVPLLFGRLFNAAPPDLAEGLTVWSIVFVACASMVATVVMGLLMTIGSASASSNALSGARSSTARAGVIRLRGTIIALQLAISMLLLASSGLLIKSFLKLRERSLGIETEHRLTFLLQPSPARYGGPSRMAAYVGAILGRVRGLPGVVSVAATSAIPMSGMDARRRLVADAAHDSASGVDDVVHYRVVSSDYFNTMSIPLRRGRLFDETDRAGSENVALINETVARLRFRDENPIGKTVTIAGGPAPASVQIIGVVGDVRHEGLAADAQPELYRPLDQEFWPFFGMVVRTAGNPSAMTKPVEGAVWSVDGGQPIDRVATMSSIAAESVAVRRSSTLILSAFAVAAALLAAIGIFGVMSYVVSQRTREIGIRVALGASPGEVLSLVIASGTGFAVTGALMGVGATLALTRYLTSLLFGVQPTDPAVIASALAFTTAVAMVAGYLPSRRAVLIDPAVTLRDE